MTDLLKPIRRRTNTTVQARRLVIEIRPGATEIVFIREEGRRNGYAVPIDAIYRLGARIEADRARAERKAKKKARRSNHE